MLPSQLLSLRLVAAAITVTFDRPVARSLEPFLPGRRHFRAVSSAGDSAEVTVGVE
jgi:hypothetical protein